VPRASRCVRWSDERAPSSLASSASLPPPLPKGPASCCGSFQRLSCTSGEGGRAACGARLRASLLPAPPRGAAPMAGEPQRPGGSQQPTPRPPCAHPANTLHPLPPLPPRWFLYKIARDKGSLYVINGVAGLATFFLCRICWGPVLSLLFWKARASRPRAPPSVAAAARARARAPALAGCEALVRRSSRGYARLGAALEGSTWRPAAPAGRPLPLPRPPRRPSSTPLRRSPQDSRDALSNPQEAALLPLALVYLYRACTITMNGLNMYWFEKMVRLALDAARKPPAARAKKAA
jgi:hypothetical protein